MQRGIFVHEKRKREHPPMQCSAYDRSLFDARTMIRVFFNNGSWSMRSDCNAMPTILYLVPRNVCFNHKLPRTNSESGMPLLLTPR
jgi:hypothetical protein